MVETEAVEKLVFKWGKKRGIGVKNKNVNFYESFVYDGVEYNLFDSVYIYGDDHSEPYIGKLIMIRENPDKAKEVKILWFFRPCEISNFLGDEKVDENELFLACGEGRGVTNINPLEAIAGKCNVICTSSDCRNLQPSDEDLQSADFFFYRFFDVGRSAILIKIDEQIAGLNVKFLFNKMGSQKPSFLKPDFREKGGEKESAKSKGLLAKGKPAIGEKLPSLLDKQHTKKPLNDKKGSISNEKTISNLRMGTLHKRVSNDVIAQTSEVKEAVKLTPSISIGGNSTSILHKEFGGRKNSEGGNTSSCKIDLRPSEIFSNNESNVGKHVNCNLVDGKLLYKDPHELNDRPLKKVKFEGSTKVLNEKGKRSNGFVEAKTFGDEENLKCIVRSDNITFVRLDEMKRYENPQRIKDDPLKESKLDEVAMKLASSRRISNDSSKKQKHDEKVMRCGDKDLSKIDTGSIKKLNSDKIDRHGPIKKLKVDKNDPHGTENAHSLKLKLNEKNIELDDAQSSKASPQQASQKDKKADKQGVAQIQSDKSKWFGDLPWREKLESAHEKGRLILLQNMDPLYTSADVEEIVSQAFHESCTAKMIHQISFSSQHSGQAFVIFRNKQVAETVVIKLDEGCLWLPNGMPLVGRFAPPLLDRQSTFVGHLNINKLKYQYQREMREAVSTSHCSQSNTLEYDMAMEWFHLQECFDKEWEMVHEKQEEESKGTRTAMKSKRR